MADEISQLWIQLRRPLGDGDPGEAAHSYYTVKEGVVFLTDANGVPIKRGKSQALTTRTVRGARDVPLWSAAVLAGSEPRQVAGRLLHQKVSSERSGSDFHKPLRYPPLSIA